MNTVTRPVVVIGGGIAGLTLAVELADTGCPVVLIEKSATLGGRVARMHQYFPKLCPPACGLEMHYKRLRQQSLIEVLTLSEVEGISGCAGDYEVTVRCDPRYVTDACTLCGDCVAVCPAARSDEANYGMGQTKAAFLPGRNAFPARYAIDRKSCAAGCTACEQVCKYGAVSLNQTPERRTLRVSAIVVATGWAPYDAARIDNLGAGRFANVVTNVVIERMAAVDGPTAGRILRPSDGREPRTVAFVQCAGSRDENHLPYCSAVCCAATMKHVAYIHALYPETDVTVFYMDLRTAGRLEEFSASVTGQPNVRLVKGKVARIDDNPVTHDVLITAEDVLGGGKATRQFELAVLATGLVPQSEGLPALFQRDDFGFINGRNGQGGLYAAGCVHRPGDVSTCVQDATATALKALQVVRRSESHG